MGRLDNRSDDDTAALEAIVRNTLLEAGQVAPAAQWCRLTGGRTNLVWRIGSDADTALICKLALPGRGTPLFPNCPQAEYAALCRLAGSGLAPDPLAQLSTPAGACLLYRACPGTGWTAEPAPVARALARLHSHPAPAGLRGLARQPAGLLAQGDALLGGAAPGVGRRLRGLRPASAEVTPGDMAFLHGDPVPGNIVMAPGRAVLIDWQCPAFGDPLHDLAVFLSPAMQVLGRGRPLEAAERAAFLTAYDGGSSAARLRLWEPAFSWRMAAYCVWRMVRGQQDYEPALMAELEHLEKLR